MVSDDVELHRIVELSSKRMELQLVAIRKSGEVQSSVYRFETSIVNQVPLRDLTGTRYSIPGQGVTCRLKP